MPSPASPSVAFSLVVETHWRKILISSLTRSSATLKEIMNTWPQVSAWHDGGGKLESHWYRNSHDVGVYGNGVRTSSIFCGISQITNVERN